MKVLCFNILIHAVFSVSLFGQSPSEINPKSNFRLEIKIQDTTNNYLFRNDLYLHSISTAFRDDMPTDIYLYRKDSATDSTYVKYYNLLFKGDAVLFRENFGTVKYLLPTAQVDYFDGSKDINNAFALVAVNIYRDTVSYRYRRRLSTTIIEGYNPKFLIGMPARFKGDMQLMEERLSNKFSQLSNTNVLDSILVFSATINKAGVLSNMELVVGEKSVFSELVKNNLDPPPDDLGLKKPSADWFAGNTDVGPRQSQIRIYVQLNQDGSVTIETPPKLGTLSGE